MHDKIRFFNGWKRFGIRSIQVHTGGECAMNAGMMLQAIDEFQSEDLDIVILENVGKIVSEGYLFSIGSQVRMWI